MKPRNNQSYEHISRQIRWDAHRCPPLKIAADLSFLSRYKNAGVNFVSLNIGFDLTTQAEAIEVINYFHH
jgi:membrane dipeptidase